MGKYRKDFMDDSGSDNESEYSARHYKPREWATDIERTYKSTKKKSKQFRQARKKRSLNW